MSKRIGGWWRLWIVGTVIIAVVSAGEHSSEWPDQYDIRAGVDLIVYSRAESLLVARHPESVLVWPDGQIQQVGDVRIMRRILDSLGAELLGGGPDPIGRRLREERLGIVADVAVGTSLLSGALLLLGLTAGWIYRGFRS
jgi:hypothetical protein